VATTLSGLTCFLAQNPEKLERLTQEIRTAFKTYKEINAVKAQQLPYLQAVLNEGLRLFPPASGGAPRVSPGFELHGKYIPEGVSSLHVHTDPRETVTNQLYRPRSTLAPGLSPTTQNTSQNRGNSSQSAGWIQHPQMSRTPAGPSYWVPVTVWVASKSLN
jgi:hypothetical protein